MVNLGAVHTAGEAELLGRHTQGSSSLPHAAASPAFAVFPAAQQVAYRKKTESIRGKAAEVRAELLEQQRALLPGGCGGVTARAPAAVLGFDAEPHVCGRALPRVSWFRFCWLFVFFFILSVAA